MLLATGRFMCRRDSFCFPGLFMERHIAKVARRKSKNHLKGPAKRIEEDDRRFEESFRRLIESCYEKTAERGQVY